MYWVIGILTLIGIIVGIFTILKKSLTSERGLASYNIRIENSTLEKIAETSNGDVRTALNGLEVAVLFILLGTLIGRQIAHVFYHHNQ